ncbi:MAG TPA: hypothetical protein VGD56_17750 [Gemmatirosa sp.]
MYLRPTPRGFAASAAVALALLGPAAVRAQPVGPQPLYVGLGWQAFQFTGLGPVTFPATGFLLTLTGPGTVRVVDGGIVGDVFQLFVDGGAAPALTTSFPNPALDGTDTGALDGDAAWADPRLGRGTLTLGPGTYVLTFDVTRLAAGTSDGQGYIDATLGTTAVAPEPTKVASVGVGLAVLFGAARRRRHTR